MKNLLFVLFAAVLVSACGGDDDPTPPAESLADQVMGAYDGETWSIDSEDTTISLPLEVQGVTFLNASADLSKVDDETVDIELVLTIVNPDSVDNDPTQTINSQLTLTQTGENISLLEDGDEVMTYNDDVLTFPVQDGTIILRKQ